MSHIPVLLRETIDGLNIRGDGIYCDGTLGLGGHSEKILERLTTGRLIGIDRDESALGGASARLKKYGARFTAIHGNFGDAAKILKNLGVEKIDGILCDFGVSSPQLDEAERGFSHRPDNDAPLDMRMDRSRAFSAYELVNTWSETELTRILFEYGEERYSRRIARAIAEARDKKPVGTTAELSELIRRAMPAAARRENQHPAKRAFQAVRIAVNDELGEIERLLAAVPEMLNPGGRAACISFHSLEDRLVKNAFRDAEDGCKCPKSFPKCVCGFTQTLRVITRKPITAGAEEIRDNPRSRSAKLRIAERV